MRNSGQRALMSTFSHFNMAATSADDYTRGYMCSRAIVSPSGNVFWPPPTKLRSTCEVDVTYFPFDDQVRLDVDCKIFY